MRKAPVWIAGLVLTCLSVCTVETKAQTKPQPEEIPKYELAAEFTSLSLVADESKAGFGGRFTYNLNRSVAVKAAGYLFQGGISQSFFGVKAGKRSQKWGIFAKARPGLMSVSDGKFDIVAIPGDTGPFPFRFVTSRQTSFALDVGGVLEFYPSKKIVTRFDFGVPIIFNRSYTAHTFSFNPETGQTVLIPVTIPAETRGGLQFTAGVGFRF